MEGKMEEEKVEAPVPVKRKQVEAAPLREAPKPIEALPDDWYKQVIPRRWQT